MDSPRHTHVPAKSARSYRAPRSASTLVAALVVSIAACSEDAPINPGPGVTGGSGGTATAGTGGSATGGSSSGTGGASPTGGVSGAGASGGSAGASGNMTAGGSAGGSGGSGAAAGASGSGMGGSASGAGGDSSGSGGDVGQAGSAGAMAGNAGTSAGSAGSSGAGMGGAGAGGVAFDPVDAVYSVALSVTTAGVTKMVALRNGGGSPVTVSNLAVSGTDAARFVPEGAPTLPAMIPAGGSLDLMVRFLPPSNSPTTTFSGSLTATLMGAGSATAAAGLYGLAMSTSNAEATFDQVVKTLGYAVNVGGTTITLGTGAAAVGDEVLVRRFVKASAATPVRLEPVARYSPWEAAPYGYYTGAAPTVTRHPLGTMSRGAADNIANRTLFPPVDAGAMLTFDPGAEAFGIFAESESNTASIGSDARFYQEDALNDDQGNVMPVHRFRAYPLKNRGGQAIPNSYLLGCEEASNSDYQDYVFVIHNVSPAPN